MHNNENSENLIIDKSDLITSTVIIHNRSDLITRGSYEVFSKFGEGYTVIRYKLKL